jgi:hypothetical protein
MYIVGGSGGGGEGGDWAGRLVSEESIDEKS